MLTEKERERILKGCLKEICHISDKEYQKRVWVRGEGPEVDSFIETAYYFLETIAAIMEEYKAFGITDTQCQMLKKLEKELDDFPGGDGYAEEFVDTPEWEKVVTMAKEVLKAFPSSETH